MSNNNEVTLEQALNIARQHHMSGNLAVADRTYRDILNVLPYHYGSLYQLALICYQQQRTQEGLDFIQKAIEAEPDQAEAWNVYGALLQQIGKLEDAIEKWKKAIEIDSNLPVAYSNLASGYWSLGEYEHSKEAAQKAVKIKPDYADGYVNYGIAVNALGDTEEAVKLWEKALELHPDHPNAMINLGNAMRDLGKLKESEEYCRKALKIAPNNTIALVNLGNALLDQTFTNEAEELYRKAIQLQPNYIDAHNNLSLVLMMQVRYDDAAAQARHALAFDPDNLTALGNLSVSLREMSQFQEAEFAARKALSLRPDSAEARIDLADILFLSDRLDEAEIIFNEAVEIAPNSPRLYMKLANVQERLNHFDDAIASLDKALKLSPDMPDIYHKRGMVYLMSNKIDESLEAFDKALEINPEFIQAIASKSETLQTKGDMDAARETVQKGLKIDNSFPSLYYTLSKVKKFTADDPDLKKMIEIAENAEGLGHAQATALHFALFKAYQDIKDYDAAFDQLMKGNDRKRSSVPYDRDAQNKSYDTVINTCNADFMKKFEGTGYDSDIPVFIIGMPRSGTTLTEQIISSHPDVFGAGELHYLLDVETKHGAINTENSAELGKSYVEMTQAIHPDAEKAKRITDKMPGNYMRVAQIIASLPNAKIIHCQRNPMDTMLSCYKQLFARGQYWSYNFEEMAEHYVQYERMMEHWRQVFPNQFLEIKYEETVSDFENQARKLIDYVGLEWDDACLSPHKQERSILTASKGQVRQPIYKTSVEAWRRYEKQMQPLADYLEEFREKRKKAA
jgi:tetratricopeptide (TPR) repeat protein